jgi:uncharacterized coiled-coil protein SlyX
MSFEEDTKPGTPNILREISECIAESRALNARLENVLQGLILDLEFRKEMRVRMGEFNARISALESR